MAREYARIRVSIADDDDLENLSMDAQWLYFRVLIPEVSMNLAGVVDWRPKRLIQKARDCTMERFLAAAAELEQGRYVLFDLDTDEAFVRALIRSDEVMRNPKSAVGVVRAYRATASKTLRSAIVSEVVRERNEHPDFKAWSSPISKESMDELVSKKALQDANYANQIANDFSNPIANDIGNKKPNQIPNSKPDMDTNHIDSRLAPDPPTARQHDIPQPSARQPSGGYVTGEPHQAAELDSNDPPPRTCSQHPDGTSAPCRGCADARHRRDAWAEAQRQSELDARRRDREAQAAAEIAEIDACELCDDRGYVGTRVCDHDPEAAERNRRGAERVRAEMAAARARKGHTP